MPKPYEAVILPPDPHYGSPYTEAASHFHQQLQQVAEYHTGRKGYDAIFTPAEEDKLFAVRRRGATASENLEEIRKKTEQANSDALRKAEMAAQSDIAEGLRAEQALVEVNARLAVFAARASMGFQPQRRGALEARNKGDIETAVVKGRSVGTYTNIAGFASPYGDVEDRSQSGTIGVVTSVRNHKDLATRQAEQPDKKLRRVNFASYAMWAIQSTIARHMDSPHIREFMGVRQPQTVIDEIAAARKEHGTDLAVISWEQAGSWEEYLRLQDLLDAQNSREHVSIEDLSFPYGAREEAEDGQEPDVLNLAEMYPDPNGLVSPIEGLEEDHLRTTIQEVLATLSEREAGIIRLRFGLVDDKPRTLDEIGEVYGVVRTRARQIEKKTIAKLREPGRSSRLASARGVSEDPVTAESFFMGDRLRVSRPVARTAPPIYGPERQPPPDEQQTSQELYQQEMLQRVEPYEGRLRPGSPEYTFVYAVARDILETAMPHFRGDEKRRISFPTKTYAEMKDIVGQHLTPDLISQLWNEFLVEQEDALRGRLNMDRYGQLFSRLLMDCMQDDDSVSLQIPNRLQRRCGYLGAWAKCGEIIIEGDPGNYVGAGMTGTARLRVKGNAADFAGARAGGHAQIEIDFNSGNFLGWQMRDNSFIRVGGRTAQMPGHRIGGGAILRVLTDNLALEGPGNPVPDTASTPAPSPVPSSAEEPGRPDFPLIDTEAAAPTAMTFAEAAQALSVTEDTLEQFAEQVGYTSRVDFKAGDFEALVELFPTLQPLVPPTGFVPIKQAAQQLHYKGSPESFRKDVRTAGFPVYRMRSPNGKPGWYIDERYLPAQDR